MVEWHGLDEISKRFLEIDADLQKFAASIRTRCKRDEKHLALYNLVGSAARAARRMSAFVSDDSLDAIAWSTRCLYEIFVVVEFILASDANIEIWMRRNFAKDELEILDGILTMDRPEVAEHTKILRARKAEIERILTKHGVRAEKQMLAGAMTRQLGPGMMKEHEAFYKLYSKYTHPTSWLVNAPADRVHTMETRNIFIIKAQHCAIATLGLTAKALGWASEWPGYEILDAPPKS